MFRIQTALLTILLLMTGCSGQFLEKLSPFKVYKIDVQQGNVLTQEQVNQLRAGMTQNQIRFLLGTPLLTASYEPQRWDYYYSITPAHEATEIKKLSLFFQEGKLVRLSGDLKPE